LSVNREKDLSNGEPSLSLYCFLL